MLEFLEKLADQVSNLRTDTLFDDEIDPIDDFPEATQHLILGLNALSQAESHIKLASITLKREQKNGGVSRGSKTY